MEILPRALASKLNVMRQAFLCVKACSLEAELKRFSRFSLFCKAH